VTEKQADMGLLRAHIFKKFVVLATELLNANILKVVGLNRHHVMYGDFTDFLSIRNAKNRH
jgi:hypothetical protein